MASCRPRKLIWQQATSATMLFKSLFSILVGHPNCKPRQSLYGLRAAEHHHVAQTNRKPTHRLPAPTTQHVVDRMLIFWRSYDLKNLSSVFSLGGVVIKDVAIMAMVEQANTATTGITGYSLPKGKIRKSGLPPHSDCQNK